MSYRHLIVSLINLTIKDACAKKNDTKTWIRREKAKSFMKTRMWDLMCRSLQRNGRKTKRSYCVRTP